MFVRDWLEDLVPLEYISNSISESEKKGNQTHIGPAKMGWGTKLCDRVKLCTYILNNNIVHLIITVSSAPTPDHLYVTWSLLNLCCKVDVNLDFTLFILSLNSLEQQVEPWPCCQLYLYRANRSDQPENSHSAEPKSLMTQTKYTLLNRVLVPLLKLFIRYHIVLRILAKGVTPIPAGPTSALFTDSSGWKFVLTTNQKDCLIVGEIFTSRSKRSINHDSWQYLWFQLLTLLNI